MCLNKVISLSLSLSSSYITIINFDVAFVILINMLNNNGPKTELCGLPQVPFLHLIYYRQAEHIGFYKRDN